MQKYFFIFILSSALSFLPISTYATEYNTDYSGAESSAQQNNDEEDNTNNDDAKTSEELDATPTSTENQKDANDKNDLEISTTEELEEGKKQADSDHSAVQQKWFIILAASVVILGIAQFIKTKDKIQ